MSGDKPPVVTCPRCGAPASFSAANKWRPFCSERCKMIDLGCWGSETYRIPESTPAPSDEDAPAG